MKRKEGNDYWPLCGIIHLMEKYTMRKISLLLLVITLLLTVSACGKTATPIEDFEYEILDGEVEITGYIGTDRDIVIPDEIEGRPVTSIGKSAFRGYDLLTLVIPESVVCIEEYAFSRCKCLTDVELPDGLEFLGASAFADCENLQTLKLPNDVELQRFQRALSVSGDWAWYLDSPVSANTTLIVEEGSKIFEQLEEYGDRTYPAINYVAN